jgi:hypothetical protein
MKSGAEVGHPDAIWERYFPSTVTGVNTREYIAQTVLPKPRDFIYMVKAALHFAVNRGNLKMTEKDILSGEEQYSRFALDSLIVEASARVSNIEDLLLRFVEAPEIITEEYILQAMVAAGIDKAQLPNLIELFGELTFIGFEVGRNRFEFLYDEQDAAKIHVMAQKAAQEFTEGKRRFRIHRAFHAFLEVAPSKVTAPGQINMPI